jgi:hypothetical protein
LYSHDSDRINASYFNLFYASQFSETRFYLILFIFLCDGTGVGTHGRYMLSWTLTELYPYYPRNWLLNYKSDITLLKLWRKTPKNSLYSHTNICSKCAVMHSLAILLHMHTFYTVLHYSMHLILYLCHYVTWIVYVCTLFL